MHKFFFLFFIILCIQFKATAQGNNCGDVEPVLQCQLDTIICGSELTQAPIITTPSTLPDLEYAIVDHSIPSSSNTGPSVVGIDIDGIFMPDEFNISDSTNFGVIPIAYDLAQIQETLDDVLKGTYTILFITNTCCNLIQSQANVAVCDSLNAAGIYCGSDVTSLSQAATLFSATSGGSSSDSLSILDIVTQIDSLNTQLANPLVPANCGGGDKIAYAYGNECLYRVMPDTLYQSQIYTASNLVEANEVIISTSIVNAPSIVEYNSNICIELQAGFETILGADFTAEIEDPCQ